jgi:transcriptional regulator with GAF, ATPase, and Fis domain
MDIGISFYLSMYKTIATVKEPVKLTTAIFKNLREVLKFRAGGMAFINKDKSYFEFYTGELTNIDAFSGSVLYSRIDVSSLPFNYDIKNPQILVVDTDKKFIDSCEKIGDGQKFLIPVIKELNLKKLLVLPLTMDDELFGMSLFLFEDDGFIRIGNNNLMNIADVIAATMYNELSYSKLEASKDEKEMLLKLMDTLIEVRDKEKFYHKFAEEITKLIPGEYVLVNVIKHFV